MKLTVNDVSNVDGCGRESVSVRSSHVNSSRPKWPRGQNFGLGLEALASARPRPRARGFGLGLASISLSHYVNGNFSCKNHVKFGNFVNFSSNNLKSCVANHYLVLFHNYFWPRPRPHSPGLGLLTLASASASRFWPRLTSLVRSV